MIRSDDVRLDTTRCAHHDFLEAVESSGGELKEKHMGKLDGRIALITGGDHGISLVTAKEFVKEGAYVFITGCSDSRLAAAVKEIEAKELHRTSVGRNVASVQGDVSNAGDLDRVFAQIEREKGKLDVVVVATGETTSDNLAERENRSSFDIYVNGMFATVEKAIPLLGDGACVVLLTVSPKETVSRDDSAGKSAILSFWRTWIKELKDRGIRLNAVNPGPTRTGQLGDLQISGERSSRMLTSDRLRSRSLVEEVAEAVVFLASDESAHIDGKELIVGGNSLSNDVPIGRLGTPEEVAEAVVFLASDDSRGITGQELFVGAGFSELGILLGDDLEIN
jgi:NAD(P)-dependent dehydrogenase (short-subunit alcohol dehydrogenase family)